MGGFGAARRTVADSSSAPAVQITPTGPYIGAEITGIDLGNLDATSVATIREALAQHAVLTFPDQDLTPDHLLAFAKHFGEIENERFIPKLDDHPGVHVLRGISKTKLTTQNLIWHVDHSYKEHPLMLAALYALDVPATGGDTLFASMTAAYDALSERMKAYLEGLTAIHDVVAYGLRSGLFNTTDARAAIMRMPPPVEHPLVCQHPHSGRRMIFVNESWTTSICGLDPAESRAILDFLFAHATRPEFQLRLPWKERSLCLWDNLAVQHRGIPDYDGLRLMHRVSVTGNWRPGDTGL
jgi:taurine dioxygenase